METIRRLFARRPARGGQRGHFVVAVLVVLLILGSAGGAAGVETPIASPDVVTPVIASGGDFAGTPVLAYYYIWFNPDSWERAKVDFPLLGRYSSDDTEVMRQHVRWAKGAGIDGFIVSWKNTDVLTSRLRLLIDVCTEEDFQLAIIYQGLDVERAPLPAPRIAADLDFFAREFDDHPVFALFDKPLVIWSGTWQFTREELSLVTQTRRERLLILASERNPDDVRNIADLVDGNAYYWSSVNPHTFPGYVEKLQAMEQAVHERGGIWIAPAAPGFDARLLGGERVVNREGGDMLRIQLEGAIQSAPDAIGVISWNEFSENSHIEPSCLYQNESLITLAGILGGIAPPVIPCGVGGESPRATPSPAPNAGETFNVEDAESTIAVAQEASGIPGAGRITSDTSDTSASPEPQAMRVATIALLVFMAGLVAGSVGILVLRTRSAHTP